jgi:hypothetical protein
VWGSHLEQLAAVEYPGLHSLLQPLRFFDFSSATTAAVVYRSICLQRSALRASPYVGH